MRNLGLSHPFVSATGALLLCTVAFVSGVGAVSTLNRVQNDAAQAAAAALFPRPAALDPAALQAKAAVIYDPLDDRILYAKNSHMQLPLASLTKLITAAAVLNHADARQTVNVTAQSLTPQGDWGLRAGDRLSLSSLLHLGLVASSNDAMAAAAESLGADYMKTLNATAEEMGLSRMHFLNPTGLDETATTAGGYGSAYDTARLAALFYRDHPEYFNLTSQKSVSIQDGGRTLSADATAIPLTSVPGLIAAKTGYTDLAGGNLVVVFDVEIGHPLVAVVLGSTEEGRFSDMRTLISTVRDAQ